MFEYLLKLKPSDNWFMYLIKTLILRFNEHNISRIGGQLAYFFLLSLFPFLIFLNALVASFHISSNAVIDFLSPVFPNQIVMLISSYIEHISSNQSISLLSIGIVVTIFSASKSVRSLSFAINTAYGIREKRNFFYSILFSMAFVAAAGVVILLVIVLVTFSKTFLMRIVEVTQISLSIVNILGVWRWVTLAVILFFILSAMYLFVPNKKIHFMEIIPGMLFSMAGFLALTIGFSVYVTYFMRNSALYGTIGAVVLLMLWMYFAGIILILGAELNSAIEIMPRRLKRKKEKRDDHL